MKTSRLISTISYNTDMFLAARMQDLVRNGVIEFAHWIRHLPETDETKSHYHVILQPSRSLDTHSLSAQFNEPDLAAEGKFLGTMPWRFSKFPDWILYVLHDKNYLGTKGLTRDHAYTIDECLSTHPDMLREDYKNLDLTAYGIGMVLNDAVQHGRTWESVIASGVVPRVHWRYWKEVFTAMGGNFAPSHIYTRA